MKKIAHGLLFVVIAVMFVSSASQILGNVISGNDFLAQALLGTQVKTVAPSTVVKVSPVTQPATSENNVGNVHTNPRFEFKLLSLGSDDTEVSSLQSFLNEVGFPVTQRGSGSIGNETTYFGHATEAALTLYQKSVGVPVTGTLDSKTLQKINSSMTVLAENSCTPMLVSGPNGGSEGSPTLPPLDTRPYVPERRDCKTFSWDFCPRYEEKNPGATCSTLILDHHAINFIEYTDKNGVPWVCIVDPQTNGYSCMPKKDWDLLPNWRIWIKDYCRAHNLPGCDKPPTIYPGNLLCSDMQGKSCTADGGGAIAICSNTPDGEPTNGVICVCSEWSCSWKPNDRSYRPIDPHKDQ